MKTKTFEEFVAGLNPQPRTTNEYDLAFKR